MELQFSAFLVAASFQAIKETLRKKNSYSQLRNDELDYVEFPAEVIPIPQGVFILFIEFVKDEAFYKGRYYKWWLNRKGMAFTCSLLPKKLGHLSG